jgi:diadenosine tetraphosphate (Ap4A) HIT family hydrolase
MYPYNGTRRHILFISRRHVESPAMLSPAAWRELGALSKWAIQSFRIPGGSIFMRFGNTEYTGATINHLHAHIVSGGRRIKRGRQSAPIETRLAYFK